MATRFSIESVFKAVDKVSAPVSRMQNRILKMTRSITRGLRKVNRAIKKVSSSIITSFRTAAISAAVAVTGLAIALNKTADSADLLAKQSRRLKFPIKELQEWKFVAEQSGVSTELFDSSLGAFSKRLGEAKGGTGALVTGLKKINPQLLKQLIQTRSVSKAFEIYINAIRNSETATEKAALASSAFSRAGLKLINIADNSAETIKKLRMEQIANGVITKEQAQIAEAYNDSVNSMQRALKGFMDSVLIPIMPHIKVLVDRFREWIIVNKDFVASKVLAFVKNMTEKVLEFGKALGDLDDKHRILEQLKSIMGGVSTVFSFLGEHGKTIAIITVSVLALSVALNSFIAVMTAINIVMAINPLGILIIGVSALIGGFISLIKWIDNIRDSFSDWKKDMPEVVQAMLKPIELLLDAIKFVKDAITNFDINSLVQLMLKPIKFLLDAIKFVKSLSLNSIGNKLSDFLGFESDNEDSSQQTQPQAQMISPQERLSRSIEERREISEATVTIKDETGKATVTNGSLGNQIKLASTGNF